MRQSLRCKEVWRILSFMAYMGYSYGFVFMFLLYHVDILFVFDYNLVLESIFFGETLRSAMVSVWEVVEIVVCKLLRYYNSH